MDAEELPEVGDWAENKHSRIRRYVDITRGVRKMFTGPNKPGTTYIELFSGPGQARLKDKNKVVDGSPVIAVKAAKATGVPFTEVHFGDLNTKYLESLRRKIESDSDAIFTYPGLATETVDQIAGALNPSGYHFAFLDPYNLRLPIGIIERLGKLQRIDLLIHISVNDLQRNLDNYLAEKSTTLDDFAPGWRDAISAPVNSPAIRHEIVRYWAQLVEDRTGLSVAERFELIKGPQNIPLYWLAFASRNPRGHEFWDKIRSTGPQRELL